MGKEIINDKQNDNGNMADAAIDSSKDSGERNSVVGINEDVGDQLKIVSEKENLDEDKIGTGRREVDQPVSVPRLMDGDKNGSGPIGVDMPVNVSSPLNENVKEVGLVPQPTAIENHIGTVIPSKNTQRVGKGSKVRSIYDIESQFLEDYHREKQSKQKRKLAKKARSGRPPIRGGDTDKVANASLSDGDFQNCSNKAKKKAELMWIIGKEVGFEVSGEETEVTGRIINLQNQQMGY